MPDLESHIDPTSYSILWLILGIVVLAAIVVWYFCALFFTRKSKATPEDQWSQQLPSDQLDPIRSKYLSEIDIIERRFHAKELDGRDVHVELAALLRRYATESRGFDASTLTVSELRMRPDAQPLADAIATYYSPEFAPETVTTIDHGIEVAREVIYAW